MKKTLKSILISSCVIFTVFSLVVFSGIALIGLKEFQGIDPAKMFAIYILSFVVSCSNTIFKSKKLNIALKYVIHLLVILSSSAVFLRIVNGLLGKSVLIGVVLIGIIYTIVFAAVCAIRKSSKEKDESYNSVYKNQKAE